jgi:hypothetical protein
VRLRQTTRVASHGGERDGSAMVAQGTGGAKVTGMSSRFMCPVCGFPGLDEPAYDDTGCASFTICPCCWIEFGYEDSGRSFAELRSEWIKSGKQWKYGNPPAGWDADTQLREAGFSD